MILNTSSESLENSLNLAIKVLNSAEPIVIPTETVYGLAARIDQPEAVKKIFLFKKRPFFDPLIVHIHHISQLKMLTNFNSKLIDTLIERFWPGPLTLVLPKLDSLNSMITSGLDSVGIRMPQHPIALDILKRIDIPLAAPSANLFGHTSPTKAIHVENDFQRKDLLIIDGGDCAVGIESTVLKITPKGQKLELCILRKGLITKSNIENALIDFKDNYNFVETVDKTSSPGHMKHHYMPNTPLIFLDNCAAIPEIIQKIETDFLNIPTEIEGITIRKPTLPIKSWYELSFHSDPQIACRELYSTLKSGAEMQTDIMIFKKKDYMNGELWEGFLERITKASSLRY
ncbi:MAG: threonylcarbamoyl-AMP synthase [Bdellovibrionaceae bacterium]|nr:threonylcarbamoyl-AMP synthase [Pseudobdellovibrionaceae bacterium]NUM57413.1 threonylcarbamoyl-AMP synthase [Pseudobdellovibrionaceae bacterium]